jgi:arabinofuranosyltransferase
MIALVAAAMGILGFSRRWISDDGLIVLRPVRQILAGNGPVLNAGERAEVATSAAWQWLIVMATALSRQSPEHVAIFGGLLLTIAGLVMAQAGTLRLFPTSAHEGALPAGALGILGIPPMIHYATSGLETGLTFGWIGASWYLLCRQAGHAKKHNLFRLGFVLGLGPLVRPDLTAVATDDESACRGIGSSAVLRGLSDGVLRAADPIAGTDQGSRRDRLVPGLAVPR